MKFIVGLSSITLISLSSVSPCLAANQSVSRSTDPSLSSQSLPSGAKTIQVAGIFDIVDKVLDTVDSERQRAEERAERKRAEQERLERQAEAEKAEQERLKRQAEAEKAEQERIAENQRQQQEGEANRQTAAEQERKQVESPSPTQQEAYKAEPSHYFTFSSNSELCKGQIANEGSICLIKMSEEQNEDVEQEASLMVFSPDGPYDVVTNISVGKLRPRTDQKEIVYWVKMTSMNTKIDEKVRKIVGAFVSKDAKILVLDEEPGGQEAHLKKYDKEIRLLLSALK